MAPTAATPSSCSRVRRRRVEARSAPTNESTAISVVIGTAASKMRTACWAVLSFPPSYTVNVPKFGPRSTPSASPSFSRAAVGTSSTVTVGSFTSLPTRPGASLRISARTALMSGMKLMVTLSLSAVTAGWSPRSVRMAASWARVAATVQIFSKASDW